MHAHRKRTGMAFVLVTILHSSAVAQTSVEAPDLLPSPEPKAALEAPAESKSAERAEVRLPVAHHPWCRFEPGAWRTKRITTETFDADGQRLGASVTAETETLNRVEESHYLLDSQSVVEVGGQSLDGPERQHSIHLLTNTADEPTEAVEQPPAQINLDGRAIPCSVWRLTVKRNDRKLVHEIYYNDSHWPFVLRREIVESSATDESPLSTTQESVVRTQVPIELGGKIVSAAHIVSTTENAGGRTERFEIHSAAVPGGLVSRSTTEWDSAGRRIRWSATELDDFGLHERSRRPLRRFLRRGRDR